MEFGEDDDPEFGEDDPITYNISRDGEIFSCDGVIERVKEPRSVRYLIICKHSERVNISFGGKTGTLWKCRSNHSRNKCAVAKSIGECIFVRPV